MRITGDNLDCCQIMGITPQLSSLTPAGGRLTHVMTAADNCMKKMDIAQRKEKVKQDSTFRGLMREKNINLDEKG
ncbi:hypothetical protein AVEN_115103-1 [Araneus ventricosus]|uniref:Uncharacterized protein n=1 Tax=Araneus ventricosus TaxID=182803 RepID=A0A4Y1ZX98_ARAVE|nr:hypothetical protein AVEN_115103-1 [Araneus ventricosus]